MSGRSNVKYAYLATLMGVIVGGVSMVYSSLRSLLFPRGFRSHSFMNGGNFTGSQFGNFTARQFGNFTANFNGPPRLAYATPYSSFVNELAIVAVMIAMAGVVWLGIALSNRHLL